MSIHFTLFFKNIFVCVSSIICAKFSPFPFRLLSNYVLTFSLLWFIFKLGYFALWQYTRTRSRWERFGFLDHPTMSEGVRKCPKGSRDSVRVSGWFGMVRAFGLDVRGFPRGSRECPKFPRVSRFFRECLEIPRGFPRDSPRFSEGVGVLFWIKKILNLKSIVTRLKYYDVRDFSMPSPQARVRGGIKFFSIYFFEKIFWFWYARQPPGPAKMSGKRARSKEIEKN